MNRFQVVSSLPNGEVDKIVINADDWETWNGGIRFILGTQIVAVFLRPLYWRKV